MKANKGQVADKANATPQDAINNLFSQNPQGGEITLNDFNKLSPTFSRQECIDALRAAPDRGVFLVGRRGHLSRWVYGDKAKEVAEKVKARRSYLAGSSQTTTESGSQKKSQSLGSLSIRIKAGDHVQTIPLEIDLVGV